MFKTLAVLACASLALLCNPARAAVGATEIPGIEGDGPVTLLYPSDGEASLVERDHFKLPLAWDGTPVAGNGRLVVISHGSGSLPWVHANLARAFVEAGFVVALPRHRGDNAKDDGHPGPESWRRRPAEVARAIDAVAQQPRFASLLALDRVGMYGMSAGGHTALTLAGGRWSPARLLQHCEANIGEDFQACAGLTTRLTGGVLDGLKKTVALWVLRTKLDDSTWYAQTDPRIAAIVAGVPFAADFDPASLAAPSVPLGLVTARKDQWLVPRFHSDPIAQACTPCEPIADLADGGHGALLSPLRTDISGVRAELVSDPPGFDRSTLPALDRKIVDFFRRHLLP